MQHRGIQYDIKMGAGQNIWVWTVHLPRPKQGEVKGTRGRAVAAAERAISNWCSQHQLECEPNNGRRYVRFQTQEQPPHVYGRAAHRIARQ